MLSRAEAEDSAASVDAIWVVLVRTGPRISGFPVAHVVETMRPLPPTRFVESPGFVRGASIIRGRATPVVDLGALLGVPDSDVRRYLTIRAASGHLALAVEEVLGVRNVAASVFFPLPPLLGGSEDALVDRIGVLDSRLLLVLRAGRILPSDLWRQLTSEDGR